MPSLYHIWIILPLDEDYITISYDYNDTRQLYFLACESNNYRFIRNEKYVNFISETT